jgi:hypothetical protein
MPRSNARLTRWRPRRLPHAARLSLGLHEGQNLQAAATAEPSRTDFWSAPQFSGRLAVCSARQEAPQAPCAIPCSHPHQLIKASQLITASTHACVPLSCFALGASNPSDYLCAYAVCFPARQPTKALPTLLRDGGETYVALANGALHVADHGAVLVVKEFDAHLERRTPIATWCPFERRRRAGVLEARSGQPPQPAEWMVRLRCHHEVQKTSGRG